MAENRNDFWSVADGCAAFDCSDKTLRKLRKDSGANSFTRDGKVYFDMNAVRRYIMDNNLGFEEQAIPNKEGSDTSYSSRNSSEHTVSDEGKGTNSNEDSADKYTDREQGLVANMHGLQRSLEQANNQIERLETEKSLLIREHNEQIVELKEIYNDNINRVEKANKDTITTKDEMIISINSKAKYRAYLLIACVMLLGVSLWFTGSEYKKRVGSEGKLASTETNLITSEDDRTRLQDQLAKQNSDLDTLTDKFRMTSDQVIAASKEYGSTIKEFSDKLLEANSQISGLENKLKKEQAEKEELQLAFEEYIAEVEAMKKPVDGLSVKSSEPNQFEENKVGEEVEKVEGQSDSFNGNHKATNLLELADRIRNEGK